MERVETALQTARELLTQGSTLLMQRMLHHKQRLDAGEQVDDKETEALARLALSYSREANRLASLELRVQQTDPGDTGRLDRLQGAATRIAQRAEKLNEQAQHLPISKAELRQAAAEAAAWQRNMEQSDPGAVMPLPKRVRRVLRKLRWEVTDLAATLRRLADFAAQHA